MATGNQECSICDSMSQVQVRAHKNETTLSTEFSLESYGTNLRLFPYELDLIHLVYLEYALEFGDVCLHSCVQRKKELETIVEYLTGAHWKLLEIKEISQGDPRQHSAAFYNTASHQLVIVHRGTEFIANRQSAKADFQEIVKQDNGPFSAAAYLFTKEVVDRYGNEAESITVTGHSLGGWLSQCATFYMKYPEYLERLKSKIRKRCHGNLIGDKLELIKAKDCKARHLHCVSFDGPGCKEVLEKLFPKYLDDRSFTFQKLDALDITVYLTSQNFVNISNQQVGSVFRMDCESVFSHSLGQVQEAGILRKFWHRFSKKEWREQFLESHSSEKILEFWNAYDEQSRITGAFFSDQSQVARVMKVTNWAVAERMWLGIPIVSEDETIKTEEMNPFKFRMSCFDDNVRQSIRQLMTCKKHYSNHSVWQDYCKRPSIAYLTTRFECFFDFQVVKLARLELQNLSEYGKGLYRDCFIHNIQVANEEFKRLGIDAIFPNYLEAMYISNTDHYVKTLPNFLNDGTESELETFIRRNFANQNNSRFVIKIGAPKHGTRICTAKIYNVLKSLSQEGSDAKYLQDRKQFFVLSTTFLSKLHETLGISSDLILPNLKHVVIECETEPQLELVKDWIDKLWSRGGIETKIVIIHGFGVETRVTRQATAVPVHNLEVDQNHILQLCANVNPISLIQNHTISFKREGAHIYFRDLVSEDEYPHFYNELASLGGLAIYSTFQRGCLGEFLPKLDEFDESCFQERTYQEIEVCGYQRGTGGDGMELIYILSCAEDRRIADKFSETVSKEKAHVIACCTWAEVVPTCNSGHVLEVGNYRWHSDKGKENRGHKLVWRKTFGNPDMSRLKLNGFGHWNWRHLVKSDPSHEPNRVKIIADEPGMGKTTIMQKLAMHSQKIGRGSTWTIFIELGKSASKLEKTEMKLDNLIEALAKIEADKDWQVIAIFLRHLLQEEGRVRIFLDGFDEIKESLQQIVLETVNLLARETKARIFIASRDRLLSELTEKLKIPCYKLNPLSKEQGHEFLEKYWTLHRDFALQFRGKVMKNQQNLRNFIIKFFKRFREAIGTEADKFVGIPFQLGMLAEGYMRNKFFDFFTKFSDFESELRVDQLEEHVPTFSNIIDLYKNFITTKIETGLQAKQGALQATESYAGSVKKMQKLHRFVGFVKIFSAQMLTEICPGALALHDLSSGKLEKLHNCGIVKKFSSRPPLESDECDESEFVHRTVAEFLAADLIFSNLQLDFREQTEKMKEFLNSYIFLSKYGNVLSFLNKLILADEVGTPDVFRRVVRAGANMEEIAVEQFRQGNMDVDRLGRNLLHYIICYCKLNSIVKCDVCEGSKTNCFLMKAEYLFGGRDLFDATPFAYVYSSTVSRYMDNFSRDISLAGILLNENMGNQMWMSGNGASEFLDSSDGVHNMIRHSFGWGTCREPCPGALDSLNVDEIIAFVGKNSKYLSDCSIHLRRNEGDRGRMCPDLDTFDLQEALQFSGGSRISFVCELGQAGRFRKDARGRTAHEGFEARLFAYMRENNFELYEKLVKNLCADDDYYLLKLFLQEGQNQDDLHAVQDELYEVWRKTEFISIVRGMKVQAGAFEYFGLFHPLTKSIKKHNVDEQFILNMEHTLSQLPTESGPRLPEYKTRHGRFVCVFPIIHRLLTEEACEKFIKKHNELISETLRNDPVVGMSFYKKHVEVYLDSLYSTNGGRVLLGQFKNEL